jgi:hypothetical protein
MSGSSQGMIGYPSTGRDFKRFVNRRTIHSFLKFWQRIAGMIHINQGKGSSLNSFMA